MTRTPDPLAYGPTGVPCGCGMNAHSNLVPCQPDTQPAPYTDDDLRAEAARQAAADVDPLAILTDMADRAPWCDLDTDAFNAAHGEVVRLVEQAADLSEWAVGLGADGLEPDEHTLTWSAGTTPIVRLHMAFHPRMSADARAELATQLAEACGRILADAAGPRPTDQS